MINTNAIFNIQTEEEFENLALKIFKFQFENNRVYRSFCDLLYKHPSDVKTIQDIPFLPIQFFKTHDVLSSKEPIQTTFTSSGTTGNMTSKHLVTDLENDLFLTLILKNIHSLIGYVLIIIYNVRKDLLFSVLEHPN